MKVLFCGKGLGMAPIEGIRNFTINLARSLNEMGVKVDILTDLISNKSPYLEPEIRYFDFKKTNIKKLLENYDIVHLHGTLLQMSSYKMINKNLKFITNRYFPANDLFRTALLVRLVDKIVVASRYLMKLYLNIVSEEKISFIPLACDKRFKDLNINRDIDILFNGGVARETGIYTLLSAAKDLEDLKFVLALREIDTYPKIRNELKKYIIKNNLKNIKLIGLQKDMVILYNKTKIFVQPTEDYKVKMLPPLSVFEASACNCIVLMSDVPWHLELTDVLGGLSFKAKDKDDLSEKILQIISKYKKYYNRVRYLKKLPTMYDVSKKYLAVYEEVLEP